MDAVLFDLDDTLCTYRRSGRELLSVAFEEAGVEPFFTLEDYHARYPDFLGVGDSMAEMREACFAAVAEDAGRDPTMGRRVARAYAEERDHANVEPLDGVEAALAAVGDYPTGLVTNGSPDMQRRKLSALGLEDAFDVVVCAGYDAPAKPDPGAFDPALEALGADPARTLHVGNSLQSDVAGARAAGVGSVWVPDAEPEGPPDPRPDHTISTLAELEGVLTGNGADGENGERPAGRQ